MKKVAIVPYLKKAGVPETTGRLVKWLGEHDVEIALPEAEALEMGFPECSATTETLFDDADIVVALGGDGTTLRAVRLMGERTVPVLGVNLGEIGFLMWVNPDQMESALDRISAGDFRIEERHMLQVRINLADGGSIERLALNDVLIGREEFSRLIKLDVLINKEPFCRYVADGVLVSTPTGSTAYSFSAGGPVVSPAANVFTLVPVCPHSLNNRCLVLSERESLTVGPCSVQEAGGTGVSVDGVPVENLGAVSSIDINIAENKFKFIGLNGQSFYAALRHKLKGWLGLV